MQADAAAAAAGRERRDGRDGGGEGTASASAAEVGRSGACRGAGAKRGGVAEAGEEVFLDLGEFSQQLGLCQRLKLAPGFRTKNGVG